MKIKRIVVLVFSFVLLLGNICFAYPQSDNTRKIVVNEYLKMKELKSKSNNVLKSIGFKDDEIKNLKELSYSEYIEGLDAKEDKELKGLGYDDKQIDMIRNFQGTEAEMVALSATLTVTASTMDIYDVSTTTYSGTRMNVGWSWSSRPFWLFTDYLGVAWSDGFYTDTTEIYITYKNINTGNTYLSGPINTKRVPGAGCTADLQMQKVISHYDYDWACSGGGTIVIYYPGKKTSFEWIVEYGHTYITATGGVDIEGIPSISFEGTTSEEGRAEGIWEY